MDIRVLYLKDRASYFSPMWQCFDKAQIIFDDIMSYSSLIRYISGGVIEIGKGSEWHIWAWNIAIYGNNVIK